MIKRLLIANRGEIAVRIIRTCKEMGISTVAVFSEADKNTLAVKMADKSVCIGPAPTKSSYLNVRNLISAALGTDCDAIHPGVGFLSENAEFAEAVRKAGLIYIGASAEVIELLGDKVKARKMAEKYGLMITPGSKDSVNDPSYAKSEAERIGFPIIIKAAAGGGGRGMRIVRCKDDIEDAVQIAAHEAETNFSDGTIFMEKYLENPRHVEIQILADGKGEVLILGERDCSVQKNHQKLLEESPSTVVSEKMRSEMGQDAIKLFSNLNYAGAGTIEFLVYKDQYYFMEVNARVQVEHPVSEMVTGVDIIRQQILTCCDEPMEITQEDISISGHAIETRINALTPGKVSVFDPPNGMGVRCDTFLETGADISPHYDSLAAKIIVHAPDRKQCLAKMYRSLEELNIEGIKTNVDSQLAILKSREFTSGNFGTKIYNDLFED